MLCVLIIIDRDSCACGFWEVWFRHTQNMIHSPIFEVEGGYVYLMTRNAIICFRLSASSLVLLSSPPRYLRFVVPFHYAISNAIYMYVPAQNLWDVSL